MLSNHCKLLIIVHFTYLTMICARVVRYRGACVCTYIYLIMYTPANVQKQVQFGITWYTSKFCLIVYMCVISLHDTRRLYGRLSQKGSRGGMKCGWVGWILKIPYTLCMLFCKLSPGHLYAMSFLFSLASPFN